ncbi:MAG: LOG family protein [Nitrospira sp.]|nr:LOG family protein [Nitrospira sp.]MDH4368402.1 LOG family protein [Nitrospira sp.]MDH5346293.1 LOG family protein [Nitrospira sp.]MDH5497311.1 LOG family protein [Nitrospira sp.]MDH5724768.1 LOG family protein [Nitrospira sp.]
MPTTGKSSQSRSRPVLSPDEILHHISTLLNRPEDDLHAALMRELLTGLLKLNDAHLDLLDIKIVNRAVKELRHAFGVFHGYRDRRKVSIFGSARTPSDDPNYQLAHQFAHAIVREGFMVITGGADGIMRAAQEGAGRENSFGVNIMLPFEQGPNSTIADDEKLITFKYFFTRKLMFQKEANAIALFPGGFGTHDEGFEILTLAQTGKSDPQPIICLQAPGCDYWNDWSAFVVRQLLTRKLINEEDMSLFVIVDSAEAAVGHILRFYRQYHSMRFVGRQLAMRLRQTISSEKLEQIRDRFTDLLSDGTFELCGPLEEELDEPALRNLPRLVFNFNRRSAGRLRQLISHLNGL